MVGTRQNAAASTCVPASICVVPPLLPVPLDAPVPAAPDPPPGVPDPLLVPLALVPAVPPPPPPAAAVVPDDGPWGLLLAQPAKRPSRIDEAGATNRRTKRVMMTSVQEWVDSANWGPARSPAPKAGAGPLAHRMGGRRPSSQKEALSGVRPPAPTTRMSCHHG